MPLTLSPELCAKIVQWSSSKRSDLAALCLTSKAFQREAEVKLYANLNFSMTTQAHLACRTLIAQDRLASLVKVFWFNQDNRRTATLLGPAFWEAIHGALTKMRNLENLLLFDHGYSNTWIFDPTQIHFQLLEAKLRFAWDMNVVRFLESQKRLQVFHLYDQMEEIGAEINPARLPPLNVLDAALMIGIQFFSCPLTHLQLVLDSDILPSLLLEILAGLAPLHKTLRSLNLLEMHEILSTRAFEIVANCCPLLRHVGHFPLPIENRHEFHASLLRLHYLRTIELDVTRWVPQPILTSQRALATEIKTFCPTIRTVAFWMGATRFKWTYSGEAWNQRTDTYQHPQYTFVWATA